MLLIVEIIMLIAGIWALATGKIPSILFGGPHYKLEGRGVRLLGVILMLPIPVALSGGVVLALLFGEQASGYAILFELAAILVVAIAALVVARHIRQPRVETDENGQMIEGGVDLAPVIGRKAQGSLIYALLGGLGVAAVILCPLAFIRSGQALKMIDKHQLGEQYRGTAKAARILSVVIFVFWAAVAICVLSGGISGLTG